ncbi:MAG: trypsin-like peptidase domain-containing protein [Candidatus Melainabacteria bacterium]|nr:trypsin-like peptidase domain-containing protein [Candidatus Melainabacteria bacterium]
MSTPVQRVLPKILSSLPSDKSSSKPPTDGTLSGLTSNEVHSTETVRFTEAIDLTAKALRNIGTDTQTALLQRGVVRLRVVLNGKDVGAGSGIVISPDGLILSVNHVPALGQQAGPFEFIAGTSVLRNLKSWHDLLGQKGEAKLIADFPFLPKPEPPNTVFTPRENETSPFTFSFEEKTRGNSRRVSPYSIYNNDTIETVSVPVEIIAESPSQDLMLARIALPETKDPYPFVKITDSVPHQGTEVYSIGHPYGIAHNSLALGEVLDPNFEVNKIRKALEAHGIILGGLSNVFGRGSPKADNFISTITRALSLQLAGIDVEPLTNFLNGAIISTNAIDHGSSGGLLCNKDGEVVGVTYLGLPTTYNSAVLRYLAGVLDLRSTKLPLSYVTGSVGMEKAIPFLEEKGVNVTKIRDGEPAGVEKVTQRVSRQRARESMKVFLLNEQKVPENEVEAKLDALGLGEEKVDKTQRPATPSSESKWQYYIAKHFFFSKPTGIKTLSVKGNTENPDEATLIKVNAEVETEGGSEVINIEIDPSKFKLEYDVDRTTKGLLTSYFIQHPEIIEELSQLQKKIAENNPSVSNV